MDDVVAVVTDLFFQSRISSAMRHEGRSVRFVTGNAMVEQIDECALALVDLDADLDVLSAIGVLRARGTHAIVAFGPHVDTEARKAARRAGADRVLAKSRFVVDLPRLARTRDGSLRERDARADTGAAVE